MLNVHQVVLFGIPVKWFRSFMFILRLPPGSPAGSFHLKSAFFDRGPEPRPPGVGTIAMIPCVFCFRRGPIGAPGSQNHAYLRSYLSWAPPAVCSGQSSHDSVCSAFDSDGGVPFPRMAPLTTMCVLSVAKWLIKTHGKLSDHTSRSVVG